MEKVTSDSACPTEAIATYDLIVVGGGPAGTAAAITSARSGARVLLLERGRLPRQRVCGEFVSAESLDLLAGLLENSDSTLLPAAPCIREARLFVDGRTISTPLAQAGVSIPRFDLDSALWQAAERAGVDARLQTAVEELHRNGTFQVRTSSGNFSAQAVVLAAGRTSNLDRNSHTEQETQPKWLGLKAHFAESSPRPSVDLYFFEGGYCGVQPVELAGSGKDRGRVNACAMVRADVARSLPEVFARHPQLQERSNQWDLLMEPVSTSPLRFHEPQPVQDALLRVGDAAGFVDPFVGDGISLALRSGAAAAQCLIPFFRGKVPLADAGSRYAHIYRGRLLPIFRNSSRLRRLLRLPKALRIPIGYVLENAPGLTRYLVNMTR